jgi:hypothetical protein|tara:strand:- start:238 stop:984 length:747 start_codon:yes stop_codon:yes gene_type:complete
VAYALSANCRELDGHFKQTKGDVKMATILGQRYPILTLKNGLTVVNYGSNHEYTFDTDEVLGACSDEVCNATKLDPHHTGIARVIIDNAGSRLSVNIPEDKSDDWREYVFKEYSEYKDCKMWLDVFINYQISDHIMDDILIIAEMDIINIILVPYPLMNAWSRESSMQREIAEKMDNEGVREFSSNWEFALLKMRTCHLASRVDKINHHDRFCGSEESSLAERLTVPAQNRTLVDGVWKVLSDEYKVE